MWIIQSFETVMCNSNSRIGIGIGFQGFSGMLELESELNWRLNWKWNRNGIKPMFSWVELELELNLTSLARNQDWIGIDFCRNCTSLIWNIVHVYISPCSFKRPINFSVIFPEDWEVFGPIWVIKCILGCPTPLLDKLWYSTVMVSGNESEIFYVMLDKNLHI